MLLDSARVGVEHLEVRIAPHVGALAPVRRVLRSAWDAAPVVDFDIAALLLTELAANALDHAEGTVHIVVDWRSEGIRCSVFDAGTGEPVLRDPDSVELRGRGVLLMDRLADAWGVDPVVELDGTPSGNGVECRAPACVRRDAVIAGKWVWFELRAGAVAAS